MEKGSLDKRSKFVMQMKKDYIGDVLRVDCQRACFLATCIEDSLAVYR